MENDRNQWPEVDTWWGRRWYACLFLYVHLREDKYAATTLIMYPNYRSYGTIDAQLAL